MQSKKIVFLSSLDLNLYLFRLPIMIELIKRGYDVFAVCPKGNYFDKFKEFAIKAIDYKIERESLNPFSAIQTIINISKILRQIQPDILHTFTHKPNIYGTIAGKMAGVKIILNLIEGLGSFYVNNDLKSKLVKHSIDNLYRLTFRLSKKCVFVNTDDPLYYLSKGIISKRQIHIIKSVGVDTDFFKPIPKSPHLIKELGLSKQEPIVLMIARVIKDKGVLEYIKAAEKLKDKAIFLYAGDIDKGNKNALKPDFKSVRFLGFRKDIKDLISIADLVVLPSYREGVPRTLLEAGAMGKPLVATDVPGCRDVVVDGYNGFLVPVKDVDKLVEKIDILIKNEKLREEFGKNSRERIKSEFDVRNVLEKYMRLYEELASLD